MQVIDKSFLYFANKKVSERKSYCNLQYGAHQLFSELAKNIIKILKLIQLVKNLFVILTLNSK